MKLTVSFIHFILAFTCTLIPVYVVNKDDITKQLESSKESVQVLKPSDLYVGKVLSEEELATLSLDIIATCRGVESYNCYMGYFEEERFALEVDINNKLTAYSYDGNFQQLRKLTKNNLGDIVIKQGVAKEQLTNNGEYGFVVDIMDKQGINYEVVYMLIKNKEYFLRFENDVLVSVEKA